MKHPSPLRLRGLWRALARRRLPGQVVIQYTTRCNASCAQCGMRVQNRQERATMDPDRVRRALDAMAERGVAAVSFTGGEPLLCLDEIAPLMRHAHAAGIPYVRTGTNGFLFRGHGEPGFEARVRRVAETLADTPLQTFWISLDSADPAVHEANRGLPGMVAGLEKALPIFREYGIHPAANLGINRLTGGEGLIPGASESFDPERFESAFRRAFRRFYAFAESLGFVTVNACYPMSMDEGEAEAGAVYAATSREDMIRFTAEEKTAMFRALSAVIPEFRHRLRIFTPRSALYALERQARGLDPGRFPCRGGIDFFFMDAANMDVFPCGYRGAENLGRFEELDPSVLDPGLVCERCDWECFRDPGVLAQPLMELLGGPRRAFVGLLGDRDFRRLWWEDLRYYRACGWFNARRPPDYRRMARFGRAPVVMGAVKGAAEEDAVPPGPVAV